MMIPHEKKDKKEGDIYGDNRIKMSDAKPYNGINGPFNKPEETHFLYIMVI